MPTTTASPKKASIAKKISVDEIAIGDVFSEMSHYSFLGKKGKDIYQFKHHGSGQVVDLGNTYVEDLLCTANQYSKEVEVGKEDKYWTDSQIADAIKKGEYTASTAPKAGDVRVAGIRTVWENIHSAQVFKVCYQKQDTPLSAKKFAELKDAQISTAIKAIESAKAKKTGVADAATAAIKNIQDNPILPMEVGEMRVLTGYKIQFTSRDGRYDCVDMDITTGSNIRPVNILTLAWIIFDGVKYIVK